MFEIRIDRTFSASHALGLPGGGFEPMHGHNWPVRVTVGAPQLDALDTVMDFHELERSLQDIVEQVHNRHLNEVAPFAGADGRLAVNPTAERVAQWIGEAVAKTLPASVKLLRVEVGEAPGCTAVYVL